METGSNIFLYVGGVKLSNSVQTTSFNTDAVRIVGANGYSVSIAFTGTTTGTFKLQASNDLTDPNAPTPGNFVDIPGSQVDLSSGSPVLWNVYMSEYAWVRLVHTDTGGGDLTVTSARISVKG